MFEKHFFIKFLNNKYHDIHISVGQKTTLTQIYESPLALKFTFLQSIRSKVIDVLLRSTFI